MDEASIVMIVAGAAVLITRGSLLVAPNVVDVLYLQSLLTSVVVRLSGLVLAGIGVAGWFYLQSDRARLPTIPKLFSMPSSAGRC